MWKTGVAVMLVLLLLGGIAGADEPKEKAKNTSRVVTMWPLVKYRSSGDASSFKFLNLPLCDVFSYSRDDEGKSSISLIDLPLFELFGYSDTGERRTTSFLDMPLVEAAWASSGDDGSQRLSIGAVLVRAKKNDDERSFSLLKLPGLTFYETSGDDEGNHDRRFMDVLLLPSLYRQRRTDDQSSLRLLFFNTVSHHADKGDLACTEPEETETQKAEG